MHGIYCTVADYINTLMYHAFKEGLLNWSTDIFYVRKKTQNKPRLFKIWNDILKHVHLLPYCIDLR